MTDVWSERLDAYVASDAHREGADLELLVTWARGASSALDVATGGGHVARRLREEGLTVVSCDAAPGMGPDVVCPADDLPFADDAFDVVACRTAAHHFPDVPAAVAEMARVARDRVLLVDTVFMGDAVEEAEALRDPSHGRNLGVDEWTVLVREAGLEPAEVVVLAHEMDFASWLARTGCEGDEAARVEDLLADRVQDGRLTLDKVAIRAAVR